MPLWELARKVESDRVRLMWWASRHRAESRQIQSLAMLLSMLAKQPHRPARKVVSENTANENNHMQCRCECWRERSWVAAYAWCYEHQGTEQHPDKYNHMQCCCQCLKISLIALIVLMDLKELKPSCLSYNHGAHVPHSPRRPSSPLDPHDDDKVTRSQSVKVTATNESICADFLS